MRNLYAAVGLALIAGNAMAQGNLSMQGFGYPSGGLSTRSAAAGGSLAEFDFASTRNPSSLLGWGRGGLYFQYEPEFRSVAAGAGSDRTMTPRFPLVMAAVQVGSRTMAAISSSTLLDRTWQTRIRSGQVLGSDSVEYTETVRATGAVNDMRLAIAYSVASSFSIGIGLHGYVGQNRMLLVRQFDDSVRFGTLRRDLTLGYDGTGVSLGATWRPHRSFAVAGSYRRGGSLDIREEGTLAASGKVPDRLGVAVRFDGLPGASVAVSVDRNSWSAMRPLASSDLSIHDTWDLGVGSELVGPRLGGAPSVWYIGYRSRGLPFSVLGPEVSERVASAGLELPLAGPRALLDLGVQRAWRDGTAGVRERAWTLSLALAVRP
jgi:hypothetical protein